MKRSTIALALLVCGACVAASVGCAKKEEIKDETTYTVYAPDGAPALSLANAISHTEDKAFSYHVIDSTTVQAQVTGASPVADFCVMPVNLASKLLGTGTTYQMLGTVTNGNMYFLTTNGEALTSENLSTLVGKTVGVVQLPNVPGLTLQSVLNANSLNYSILGNESTPSPDAVNLKAVDATGVTPAGGCDYYLCPEPAASTKVAMTNGKLQFAGDLQELYGEGGYPQAVLVAKKSVIESAPAVTARLISYMQGSAEYLANAQPATVVDALSSCRTEGLTAAFTAANLTSQVIANSSVKFTAASACKEKVNAFLAQLIAINANSASAVADEFFYLG